MPTPVVFERSRRPEPDARTSRFEPSSHLLGPPGRRRFVLSYKGIQGGFEELWISERDRQRNRGFFSGMVRGVSNPCEGSKMLTFLYRPRLVCSSLLHLLRSWKGCSRKSTFADLY